MPGAGWDSCSMKHSHRHLYLHESGAYWRWVVRFRKRHLEFRDHANRVYPRLIPLPLDLEHTWDDWECEKWGSSVVTRWNVCCWSNKLCSKMSREESCRSSYGTWASRSSLDCAYVLSALRFCRMAKIVLLNDIILKLVKNATFGRIF